MIDSERFKLLYGPYVPPECRVGDKLSCEYRGREVTVCGISDGPIQWPSLRRRWPHSLIVCGDLIRALRSESEIAVAHHWGVSKQMVWQWRRALHVPLMNAGTTRLRIEHAVETLTPEVRALAIEAMRTPEHRARVSAARAGRPLHPNSLAAVRRVGRRRKSEESKRAQSEVTRKMWQNPQAHGWRPRHEWTDEEIALLGTDTDPKIANIIGVQPHTVFEQRRRLGIPRIVRRWTEAECKLLGTDSDEDVARKLGRSECSVARRRVQLGIPIFRIVDWTDEERQLLGTESDMAIGRKLGRSDAAVQRKREQLGIPAFVRHWTEEEDSWLGTDSDQAVARSLGRTEAAVRRRRTRRGIPAYRDE